jgi:hypothetical protein
VRRFATEPKTFQPLTFWRPIAGGDLISLAAYLFGLKQGEAAVKIAEALGIDPYE